MNLLESLVNVEVTYDVETKDVTHLIPDMIELIATSQDEVSDVQIDRFNSLAKAVMDEEITSLSLADSAFLYGLYLVLRS